MNIETKLRAMQTKLTGVIQLLHENEPMPLYPDGKNDCIAALKDVISMLDDIVHYR